MHAHIRVPPDSTGKRVHARAFLDLTYTNLSGIIVVRDTVVFGTSGILGIVSDWTPSSGTAGQMHILLIGQWAEVAMVPGETITINASLSTTAIAVAGTTLYDNAVILSGNTVDSWLEIDDRGAASTRFTEGSPLMDAYGNLKVSQTTTVGQYIFVGDPYNDLFSDAVVTGGAVTHLPTSSSMDLTVTSANAAFASRTSNKYHYFIPGTPTLVMMSIALSDAGRTGCERRWGAFDANEGFYFELDDQQILNIVVRGTTSGAVVRMHHARSAWNGDRLDGSGNSGFTLNLTQINTYWMDILYGGRMRFGIIDQNGNRLLCHTVVIANNSIRPLMRSATLPVQVNIENKIATGGASSLRWTNASVHTEGKLDYTYWRYWYDFPIVTPSGSNELCIALRSLAQISGRHNIISAYPEKLTLNVGGTGVVKVDVYWDYMTITSADFTDLTGNGSSIEGTYTGTLSPAADAYKAGSWYLPVGAVTLDLIPQFDKIDMGLCARADEATGQYVVVVVSKISGSPTIVGSLGYAEVG